MHEHVEIAGRPVGSEGSTYVIAEMSGNHLQNLDRALALVDAAADAGADAIKTQTYTAATMTVDSSEPPFRIRGGTIWDGQTLFDVYSTATTPWEWHGPIADRARSRGIAFFSSVFDATSIEFLETLDVPAYKIASAEIVDLPLIERAAATGKPLIMSTGMATISEIDDAVRTAAEAGSAGIVLLKCNSAYPARHEELNLRTIPAMVQTWSCPVGLSDHTVDATSAIAAVALGACVVEKHLTIRRSDGGPDSEFSLEPDEFAQLVDQIRVAERTLGGVAFGPTETERASLLFRRSLFVVEDVEEGAMFTETNVRAIRPADGLAPRHLREVLGRRSTRAVRKGTPMSWELLG